MSTDRLVVTEESDDDYEREDEDSEEGPSSNEARYGREETVAFQNAPRKQKVIKKKLTKREQSMKRSLKEYRVKLGLVKPDIITDREKERNLRKLATKGVVQLFNAVSDRQKTMSDAVKEKMSARERKDARTRFDGKNFDVNKFGDYGFGSAKKEMKNEDDQEMDMGEEEIDQQNFSDED